MKTFSRRGGILESERPIYHFSSKIAVQVAVSSSFDPLGEAWFGGRYQPVMAAYAKTFTIAMEQINEILRLLYSTGCTACRRLCWYSNAQLDANDSC